MLSYKLVLIGTVHSRSIFACFPHMYHALKVASFKVNSLLIISHTMGTQTLPDSMPLIGGRRDGGWGARGARAPPTFKIEIL